MTGWLRLCTWFSLFLTACTDGVAGNVKWESNAISIIAASSDKKAEALFVFTNTSNAPVEIGTIKTSCGCTSVALPKKIYAPGESGKLKVIFVFGERKGQQEKSIVVPFLDGSRDVLTLKVDIPDSVKLNKEVLVWKMGSPAEPQAFEISIVQPGNKVKAVKSLSANFTAFLKEIDPGKVYEVEVTPTRTDEPANGTIRVEVAEPGSRAIYLKVRVA
jgi:hypothetical protein